MLLFGLLSNKVGLPKILISRFCSMASEMKLSEVVAKLNLFAPESLAESWDNVGLLLEPSERVMVGF